VHRVVAVFCHAQCVEVGEEEVHLRWGFRLWCELEDDADAVNRHLFTSERDVVCRRDESRRPDGDRVAETAVDVTCRCCRQERAELEQCTTAHRWTSNHVLANGLMHEVLRRNDDASTSIDFFLRGHTKNAAEMVGV
jgi:hypothetical protein